MSRRPHYTIGLVKHALRWCGLVGGVVAMAACGQRSTPAAAAPAIAAAPALSDADARELDIGFFMKRVDRDPTGALDLARLGALYLARGRETGDPRDALLAEQVARRSLHNRAANNGAAAAVLQSALLSQHRFDEALHIALAARDAEPANQTLRAAVGEIWMELGQYDSARVAFNGLHVALGDLSVAPRRARWAEISGKPDQARVLLHAALVAAQRQSALPREQLAWFWLRVGDVEARTGHPIAADSAYRAGLVAHPGDYRILSALARSAAAQSRWRPAITYGEQAIAVALDPATLGTLSDAYAAIGDSAKAAEYAHTLDVVVLNQPGAYHRAWSLFLLDHDRHVVTVARKVREEIRTRRDVYAYDLLAWSLHKQGHDREAEPVMRLALGQGTQDAMLFYHAGMIQRALGDTTGARAQLARALRVNPYFEPRAPALARAALASLASPSAAPAAGGEAAR